MRSEIVPKEIRRVSHQRVDRAAQRRKSAATRKRWIFSILAVILVNRQIRQHKSADNGVSNLDRLRTKGD
jgi:uncharacterized protein (UPF0147 family)